MARRTLGRLVSLEEVLSEAGLLTVKRWLRRVGPGHALEAVLARRFPLLRAADISRLIRTSIDAINTGKILDASGPGRTIRVQDTPINPYAGGDAARGERWHWWIDVIFEPREGRSYGEYYTVEVVSLTPLSHSELTAKAKEQAILGISRGGKKYQGRFAGLAITDVEILSVERRY